MHLPPPFPESYVVDPLLIAGEYPLHPGQHDAQARLEALIARGVSCFIDLTNDPEVYPHPHQGRPFTLVSYAPILATLRTPNGTTPMHHHFPIMDGGVPTDAQIRAALATIAAAQSRGETCYVHCRGGIGRTGVVVGCYLVTHGVAPHTALQRVQAYLDTTPRRGMLSPEHGSQRAYVRNFKP